MKTTPAALDPTALLQDAKDSGKTPFDYIVVGSGAGGGSLAARLALEGRRVLVIEAGVDPGTGEKLDDPKTAPIDPGPHGVREVYAVPAYNAAATEKRDISWQFSVRHFDDERRQRDDQKYNSAKDPSSKPNGGARGGIFYPRTAALGGCTAHHSMVIVRPNDSDWDRIAESTGDESWRSENMQGYFAKLEDCLYYKVFQGAFGWLRWLFMLLNPRGQLDPGGHGTAGWQKTSFIHPRLLLKIVRIDVTFFRVLLGVLRSAFADKAERRRILRALARFEIVQALDPNVRSPDFPTRANRLSLIPIGTDGACRWGLREHLLDVAKTYPDRLVLLTGVHARRVLFEKTDADGAPRAVGVEVAEGLHLYGASPLAKRATSPPIRQYFASGEVILSGGTFNTPQLLMLSGIGNQANLAELGIGGVRDRDNHVVAPVVNLPGVGANLQDRYEVSVISETRGDFSVLKGATFRPGDAEDPVRAQWIVHKTGLYTTNGVALAMLLSSEASHRAGGEPDLFLFGIPAAFRGYYWGWSKELLRRTKGAPADQRNLWTWLILKAYTHNNHGTVRLLSDDPFAPPEIVFNSFPKGAGTADDVAALCDGVRMARAINGCIGAIAAEIEPGATRPDGSPALAEWLQSQAWGHHACGTCRIGSDPWQADVTKRSDPDAVLDSKFRVQGVRDLRVVDASVLPQIPGYFLVSSVFMLGEKAADTLLADSVAYPSRLERAETGAVCARRTAAGQPRDAVPSRKLPTNAIGLALSGGGIRSATFCLGVLQALAAYGRLREIDFLSTVSGGGFAGGFLGRLFTRLKDDVNDKVGRVQEILANSASPEIWWLRKNADYIASAGFPDVETNLAVLVRNLGAVHFFVGALAFATFGGLRWLAQACDPSPDLPTLPVWPIALSFWWWVPLAVLCVAVMPLVIGYWLTPNAGRRYPILPLLLWVALLGGAVYGLSVPGAALWSSIALGALLLAWLVQEVARWRVDYQDRDAPEAADSAPESVPNALVRNRVTRALGAVLIGFAVSILWVVLDSLAQLAATPELSPATAWSMLGFGPLVILLRISAMAMLQGASVAGPWSAWVRKAIVAGLAFLLATVLAFFLDVLSYLAFRPGSPLGVWTTITALGGSLIVGRWFGFLNLSSLQQLYGQKLVRTFLGASNDARVHPSGADDPTPVEISSADDDVFFDDYHPERSGGPLHLINTCVNDSVAGNSGRPLRDEKGLPMCVGPNGVSVGRRYHALWERCRGGLSTNASLVRPLPFSPDPNAFHVLARSDDRDPEVERLRLGQWMGISGAAVSTGTGRYTRVPQSLLLGLLNIRLGYWWDSGIGASKRPGRYPPNWWRWLKSLPARLFSMQATLLNEWRGYFVGPAERLWYLTDGGHFDNTGLYELIRRRLPFIIAIDAGEDPQYQLDNLAVLTRQVRLDFSAEIKWLDPTQQRRQGGRGWDAFDQGPSSAQVPPWIRPFIEPESVGALSGLRRDSAYCSALARIGYTDDPTRWSWLLLLKTNLAPPLPVDVRNYAATHGTFPNESTTDQFFRDDQWESYRALGQSAAATVFRPRCALADVAPQPPCPDDFVDVATLSWWDNMRMHCYVTMPSFLLGIVTVNSWCLRWFTRWGTGRATMRFLHELRQKYGCDHLWMWFPMRRTLLVLARETMHAVMVSDADAADPWLKKQALSRFIPDALVISSGDAWRDRRRFNERILCLKRRPRHHDVYGNIVRKEVSALVPRRVDELSWDQFQTLGERISQQVILGAGRVSTELAAQLASLVRCSNMMSRPTVPFLDFYAQIDSYLAGRMALGSRTCLVADSSTALNQGSATDVTQVPAQIGFWLFVLKDALELHVARTLALIAAHPDVQSRVRQEVKDVGALTPRAIGRLPYLEACLHEQLRLWTPVPLLLRRAVRGFALRDAIPIEAGQQILMHAGFYHRDDRVFGACANRFSPDRAREHGLPATYFFSGGRQSCPGQSLVGFVLMATLARLLTRFDDFELVDPPIQQESIPFLYNHFDVRLRFRDDRCIKSV